MQKGQWRWKKERVKILIRICEKTEQTSIRSTSEMRRVESRPRRGFQLFNCTSDSSLISYDVYDAGLTLFFFFPWSFFSERAVVSCETTISCDAFVGILERRGEQMEETALTILPLKPPTDRVILCFLPLCCFSVSSRFFEWIDRGFFLVHRLLRFFSRFFSV